MYDVELEGEYKKVCTPEATFKTRALVLATGAMGRKPSFKGEEKFLGRGFSYCATCDAAFCRDSDIAVVGLNQEALDEANVLAKFASTAIGSHLSNQSRMTLRRRIFSQSLTSSTGARPPW